jgi:hypothetical protein
MGLKSFINLYARRLVLGACVLPLCRVYAATQWVEERGHKWHSLEVPTGSQAGFTLLNPEQTGIHFRNKLGAEKSLQNQVYLNGSGVALGDINGDGLCDIYLCSLDGPNHLYLNKGNWKFQEEAKSYGVDCDGKDSTGTTLADLDGDGDLDLIVNTIHSGTLLFRNTGAGFSQALGKVAGMDKARGGMSIAIADIDGDGLLDFYITYYRDTTLMDMPNTHFNFRTVGNRKVISSVNGIPVKGSKFENRFRLNKLGGIEESGLPDVLYRNLGQFRFERNVVGGSRFVNASGTPLQGPLFEWGLSVMFRDINRDGRPDLYVCNDFDGEDRLWLNVGQGRFREAPALVLRKTSMFSMGVDFADINRDGLDDFIVVDMLNSDRRTRKNQMIPRVQYTPVPGKFNDRPQTMRNTLFLNRGSNLFAEIANFASIAASDWAWCPMFIDVDLDGFEDLLVTNGVERNARHLDTIIKLRKQRESRTMTNHEILLARKVFPAQNTANVAFRNLGNLKFAKTGSEWGFDAQGVSHGMASGDLDGDGDLDLVVNNMRSPAGIYRNDATQPRIAVRLTGPRANTRGIGARIEVEHGNQTQSQEMISGGRYLSSDDSVRVFAMPNGAAKLKVTWPNSSETVINQVEPNRLYWIDYNPTQAEHVPSKKTAPLFKSIDIPNAKQHLETVGTQNQPLIPWTLGRDGPGVAWGDLDRDGWEDLAVGNGRGGAVTLYRNMAGKGFELFKPKTPFLKSPRDILSVLIAEGNLIQSFSNHEDGLAFGDMVSINQANGNLLQKIAAKAASAGHLAMADIDGDGDLDLFVGARAMPNNYPQSASSWVYLNESGEWKESAAWSKALRNVGLVSGAVFSNIDANPLPELLLACDWGTPKVFVNTGEGFLDHSEQYGLAKFTGFWRGIDVGDFNGDGDMDFVVTNRGLNSGYETSAERPFVVFHGDIDEDGRREIIETEWGIDGKLYPHRNLATLNGVLPWIAERLGSYDHYAQSTVEDVFDAARLAKMQRLEITTLQSMVFLRAAEGFEAKPLPVEAQLSAAFTPVVADFDNDGLEDIVLSQNVFGVHPEESRQDAGSGLLLLGRGDGTFDAASIGESGLAVFGEGRGAAAADYDHDGRTDLIISQNGAKPKLFINQAKRRGLRVKLQGEASNRLGIGAQISLDLNPKPGPSRMVRLGSGYLSQNSATQIMGGADKAVAVHVAWPSGETERYELARGQAEITAVKGQGEPWPVR